ncbi:hypothetical protein ASG63_08720 [Methylobacterium sp. Leaf94]|uniref:hypothetical protein n=1 Tax=Methylobacterium sp. Leaf94 TaxID=1736250 RepID=UPI0006F99323|nr:hypothetical protein [Methylobacterium sp. Leaf94]KQU17584.1 hypothetical protein ASG63_08720 [Methylobacterium sp. Leaf94]
MAVSEFRRGLPFEGLTFLKAMPPWWQDVLAYRFEADGGMQPLLIAVRDGYLNVYAEGQSVLKIGFDVRRSGDVRLRGRIHRKYVQGGEAGNGYLVFDGEQVTSSDGTRVASYDGPGTLRSWVEAARDWSGDEKKGVAVITLNHPEVIDVEMALPANAAVSPTDTRVANRMDIVALERNAAGTASLAFYEAKLFSNGELRARTFKPRVLQQLDRYRSYVSAPDRRAQVLAAYKEACALHVEFARMRGATISPLVAEVTAGGALEMDAEPRLIIFGNRPEQVAAGASWHQHAKALEGVHVIIEAAAENVRLKSLALKRN